MNRHRIFILTAIFILAVAGTFVFAQNEKEKDDRFISYIVDTKKQDLKLYWKDDHQKNFKSILNLKSWLDNKRQMLLFAMNGGMYKQDNSPQGLFIENKRTVTPLDTTSGNGNFYLKPNGIFYITTKKLFELIV